MTNRALAVGSGLVFLGLSGGLGYYVYRRREVKPGELPPVEDDPSEYYDETWRYVPDRPISEYGDNWGSTPTELIPYFQLLEDVSGIPGSARIFSLIAYGESRWSPTAHNNDEEEIRKGSRPAYERAKEDFPKLKYAEEAANFGSGGLFAMLGPIHLWQGATYGFTPLKDLPPESVFDMRYAGYSAIVFLRSLIRNRDVRDLVDIKVGWGKPSRLSKEERETEAYSRSREKFKTQSVEAKISLEDRNTLPAKLDISGFPGPRVVYERMMEL